MFRVKICGITRPEDGQAAAAAGADAIGLNCVPESPRYVDVLQAQALLERLPRSITVVGIFMDATATGVRRVAAETGLRAVQLHGDEPVEAIAALRPLAVIKGLSVRDESIYDRICRWTEAGVDAVLLDKPRSARSSDPAPMPWHLLAPEAVKRHCGPTAPLILAGGLTPDNVAQAVRIVRPAGVDVSSGVERGAGVKDHNLIQSFVLNARSAMDSSAAGSPGEAS